MIMEKSKKSVLPSQRSQTPKYILYNLFMWVPEKVY